ncbi:MAG: T9SS type A sorting domain-containing protein [Bacteroidetes bacterium]|nr:T9SS type A sorting domain-containing protein [Bacteroidota bacterium]
MDIDQTTGYLYFVFYDRRNYSDWKTDVYIARSTDGGETFTNIEISSTPFLPSGQTFFGDYSNISAHNNKVRPIWTRLDNTLRSVWTAIIDSITGVQLVSNEIPSNFNLSQNFPNPFNPVTRIRFDIPTSNAEKTNIQLVIYDINGREITKLIDGSLNTGSYEVEWDASGYTSGVYVYKFTAGSYSETKKMIMIK